MRISFARAVARIADIWNLINYALDMVDVVAPFLPGIDLRDVIHWER